MRRIYLLLMFFVPYFTQAQSDSSARKLLNKAGSVLSKFGSKGTGGLTTEEVVAGLKEALSVGALNSTKLLSKADGFFGNALIKILMPEEAKKAEQVLRTAGLGNLVDKAILSMNRAAEDAAQSAAPIFSEAIKQMSFQDALSILKGSDTAATTYLRQSTSAALTTAFRPVIERSLEKTDATRYWKEVFEAYNKLPTTFKKVNPDLSAYVTERSLGGLFYQVAEEEKKIRKDPQARVTEILKKVFAR
jgi:hypothetical protein